MQRALYVIFGALVGYLFYGAMAAFGAAAVAFNLLTPLPPAYIGMRFGQQLGWATIAATAGLVLVTNGGGSLVMYLLQFGLGAGILVWLLRRNLAWDRAVFLTVGAVLALSLLGLVVYSAQQGTSPLAFTGAMIDNEVSKTTATMQAIFAKAEMPEAERAELTEALTRMADFMRDVLAGLTITVSIYLQLGLVLLLSVFGRGHYEIPGVRFAEWKAPEPLVWPLILAGFMVFLDGGFIKVFALNLLVIILPIYFLQGLAIIDNFFRRKALSPLVRSIGYLAVVLVNPLPVLVACMGVFDLWIDFRKPRIPKSQ